MSTELAKTYDPTAVEATAYKTWLDEGCFHADPAAAGPPYCIVIPPPNVTGALHLGHAIDNTLQDILIRQHRMAGFNTLWVPGIDHAGIATQAVVEKQLKENENKTRHDLGREELVARIWAWKRQYGDRILTQLQRLGCSCDWDRARFTLDEQCARAVRQTFFKLFEDGLIYRGKRLVNWDAFLQTSVSDDEIYHETVKTSLWHIRYPIEGETSGRPAYMVVATTRPETMLGDTAVAVHSHDARWNWAIGKSVRLPLTGRLVPIIADDILVDPKFGSGVVKVTPAHDPNDYAVWQRHQGHNDRIDIRNILTPEGKINENGGTYAGLPRDRARKAIVEDLARQGLLEKEEPYETQVGHSDRSKTAIEPYLSDQWFVHMAPLAEGALEVVRQGMVRFFPQRHAQQYLAWLGEKRDWPISRQLWWGHRIPVWSVALTPANQSRIERLKQADEADPATCQCVKYRIDGAMAYACLLDAGSDVDLVKALEAEGFVQDADVLDTWFSSALWPQSTLGWPEDTPEFQKYYPTSVLLTAREIITLWVARMVMAGMYNIGKGRFLAGSAQEAQAKISAPGSRIIQAIPFRDVVIHTTILDGRGERMSKSKGNGVDPVDVIDSHGADALRFTMTHMATETQDARLAVYLVCPHCQDKFPNPEGLASRGTCPKCKKPFTRALGTAVGTAEAPLAKPISDRFDLGRNFCNKLWNAARFVLSHLESLPADACDQGKWSLVDRWIVSRFNRTVVEVNAALKEYRFDTYARLCYDFFWRDFCDWYVETAKLALKDTARAGQAGAVLSALLDGALRLMHPMIPFITETIWWKLNEVRPERGLPGGTAKPASQRLILAPWPTVGGFDENAERIFLMLQDVIATIRNARNEHKVDKNKLVTVAIATGADLAGEIAENRQVLELLAGATVSLVAPGQAGPADAVRISAAGCELYVSGLIDADAEQQRLARKKADLLKTIAALEGRLNNPGYLAKAPAKLVQETQAQLEGARVELAKLS